MSAAGMERVGTLSIIVVDDHRGFRENLVSFLRKIPGIDVTGEAVDGQEAEEMVLSLCPDVVVMDIKMPRRSGIDAARGIKSQCPRVRIILYSMDDPLVSDWSELQVDRFIPKQRLFEQILSALLSE